MDESNQPWYMTVVWIVLFIGGLILIAFADQAQYADWKKDHPNSTYMQDWLDPTSPISPLNPAND